tara:strand:+ start:411 stop:521 length:111 start_codon:yes stop_codon:yes gene_type:complete
MATCSTPMTIEAFILNELKKVILLAARCHIGSIPNG